MLQILNDHGQELNVIANFGILLVWLFYAQILLNGVLAERRPRLIINQSKGHDLDSEILVANLSQRDIFIAKVLAVGTSESDCVTHSITDADLHQEDDETGATKRATTQGVLAAGGYMHIGSFRRIARNASDGQEGIPQWHSLDIRVLFFYGTYQRPLAAIREFNFEHNGGEHYLVQPDDAGTRLLRSRWHSRRVREWLQQDQRRSESTQ